MTVRMQTDRSGNALQVLGVKAAQNVSISGTAASSGTLSESTTTVRLNTDTRCWVSFDSTAKTDGTNGSIAIDANQTEFFRVRSGSTLSVIQDSASGTLSIGEME